jgi:hypothetical protein
MLSCCRTSDLRLGAIVCKWLIEEDDEEQRQSADDISAAALISSPIRRVEPTSRAPGGCFCAHIFAHKIAQANDPRCPFAKLLGWQDAIVDHAADL